jgi:hypothetical protein
MSRQTEEIRHLYGEFIGYLSQLPIPKKHDDGSDNESFWTQYNESVKLLSKLSGRDYSSFLIEPKKEGELNGKLWFAPFIHFDILRFKLGGLIAKLHKEYFWLEPAPFSGGPNMVITQTQEQNQGVFVQVLLDLQSKIDEKLPTLKDTSKEKTFLQKVKGALSGTQNIIGLINQILTIAKSCGVSIEDLQKLFGT